MMMLLKQIKCFGWYIAFQIGKSESSMFSDLTDMFSCPRTECTTHFMYARLSALQKEACVSRIQPSLATLSFKAV